jgi:hypothetical protein
VEGQPDLLLLAQTLSALGGRLGFGERGQKQGRQDSDNRNDHQEFNQREGPLTKAMVSFHFWNRSRRQGNRSEAHPIAWREEHYRTSPSSAVAQVC